MSEQSDTPDAPPEVIARQAKTRALTPQTAELINAKEYQDDSGKTVTIGASRATKADASARYARERAEAYAGGTPVIDIATKVVAAIKGRDYPSAPKMDIELGDRTPAFVNWLWATKPADAKVRYAYRDIWPTALPAMWPPTLPGKAKRARPASAPSTAAATV